MNEGEIIRLPAEALPTIEELDGDLRLLAEIVGVDLALQVGQRFCGTPIRCHNVIKWVRRYRNRCIRAEYDAGVKAIDLARKYRLTDRQIWNILGTSETPTAPATQQLEIF